MIAHKARKTFTVIFYRVSVCNLCRTSQKGVSRFDAASDLLTFFAPEFKQIYSQEDRLQFQQQLLRVQSQLRLH